MTPPRRTPQQRDRRFTRIRRLTQSIFVASGLLSAVLVGYAASAAKPATTVPVTVPTTVPVTVPTTVAPATTTTVHRVGTPTTVYIAPTTVPVTVTTVCYSTPSGTTVCR